MLGDKGLTSKCYIEQIASQHLSKPLYIDKLAKYWKVLLRSTVFVKLKLVFIFFLLLLTLYNAFLKSWRTSVMKFSIILFFLLNRLIEYFSLTWRRFFHHQLIADYEYYQETIIITFSNNRHPEKNLIMITQTHICIIHIWK